MEFCQICFETFTWFEPRISCSHCQNRMALKHADWSFHLSCLARGGEKCIFCRQKIVARNWVQRRWFLYFFSVYLYLAGCTVLVVRENIAFFMFFSFQSVIVLTLFKYSRFAVI